MGQILIVRAIIGIITAEAIFTSATYIGFGSFDSLEG